MFNKICSFLGFNTSESLVGLSQLSNNNTRLTHAKNKTAKKELKLSDLMRGN